jgi:hypothetical protein
MGGQWRRGTKEGKELMWMIDRAPFIPSLLFQLTVCSFPSSFLFLLQLLHQGSSGANCRVDEDESPLPDFDSFRQECYHHYFTKVLRERTHNEHLSQSLVQVEY